MVLKHHPDKRKAAGEQIVKGDNDYFTCITKGWCSACSSWSALCPSCSEQQHCFVNVIAAIEILSDPVKRRAFDSVDPTFDNTVPSKAEGKEKFFDVFAPVFERNARSVKPKKKKKTILTSPNTGVSCIVTLSRSAIRFLSAWLTGGPLKSTSPPSGPWTPRSRKWTISILFGKFG